MLGLVPVSLGPLAQMGFECRRIDGRHVLLAALDGQRLLAGERLGPAPPLPPEAAACWRAIGCTARSAARTCATCWSPRAMARCALGPLAGTGPLLKREPGTPPRVRFSGWSFERVDD